MSSSNNSRCIKKTTKEVTCTYLHLSFKTIHKLSNLKISPCFIQVLNIIQIFLFLIIALNKH